MAKVTLDQVLVTKWSGQTGNRVALPDAWRTYFTGKSAQGGVSLRAGNRQLKVQVIFIKGNKVKVTDEVSQELCLPLAPISVKFLEGELHFGPFVGMYALPSDQPGKPFGNLSAVFVDMMKLAEEQGIALYVFAPGEAQWERGYTIAHVYRNKSWVRAKRPLPDLVIPKIISRPALWREHIEKDLAQMAHLIPYGSLNNATGDKWTVHNTLHEHFATRRYLPETRRVHSPQDIEALLLQYGDVYVKPSGGTQGLSIFRLYENAGAVVVKYTKRGASHTKRLRRGSVTWLPFLQKTFCGKRPFLVQQTINLLTAPGGRPVDFRWLVQKDGHGHFGVTARVARLGANQSITTNLHTGGEATLAEDFLRQHGPLGARQHSDVLQSIDVAALEIAAVLEAKAGRIGELGIDFGLTADGSVYLIEINPRPGRRMLKDTSPQTRLLSLLRNLEYAKYVTGYRHISDE